VHIGDFKLAEGKEPAVDEFEVAFLIPVYNSKVQHMKETFESIQNQKLSKNIKVTQFWVDDGSTEEETLEYIGLLKSQERVTVLQLADNGGVARS